MRILIILITFFISFSLMAFPTVGDFVKYKSKVTVAGKIEFEGDETIFLKTYDSATDSYLKVHVNGGYFHGAEYILVPYIETWVKADTLITESYLQDVLSHCQDYGGVLSFREIGQTSVKLCKQAISGANGFTEVGLVPFGWVSYHYKINSANIEVETQLLEF